MAYIKFESNIVINEDNASVANFFHFKLIICTALSTLYTLHASCYDQLSAFSSWTAWILWMFAMVNDFKNYDKLFNIIILH